MTLDPHITPRFPVSRRYTSEVSAMGETDHLSAIELIGCASRNHRRDLACSQLRILYARDIPTAEKEGSTGNANDIFPCHANGFHE
jgi:hypothetical protein